MIAINDIVKLKSDSVQYELKGLVGIVKSIEKRTTCIVKWDNGDESRSRKADLIEHKMLTLGTLIHYSQDEQDRLRLDGYPDHHINAVGHVIDRQGPKYIVDWCYGSREIITESRLSTDSIFPLLIKHADSFRVVNRQGEMVTFPFKVITHKFKYFVRDWD